MYVQVLGWKGFVCNKLKAQNDGKIFAFLYILLVQDKTFIYSHSSKLPSAFCDYIIATLDFLRLWYEFTMTFY